MDELVAERADFALETTLSGRWLIKKVEEWRSKGYEIGLYYLKVPSPSFTFERVKKRARRGGHFVPEADVVRRYARSLDLLERVFKKIVTSWHIYDNSGDTPVLEEEGFGNK